MADPVKRQTGAEDAGGRAPPASEPLGAQDRQTIQVLVIDDERTLRESCASLLESQGYRVTGCARGVEAQELLRRRRFDIALIDLYMTDVPGTELLRTALQTHPGTIAIVMTGNPTVASSIEVSRAGAWDYLPKPFSATHFELLIDRAAHTVLRTRQSRLQSAERARLNGHSDKVLVLGTAPAFRRVIDLARRVAATDASVFLTGESGTGKELIAQFIHHHSRRSKWPLVAINCAALPETLLETEMFGHRRGAFTDAVRDKPGLLEAANGGTMFLDEVLDMSKPIQAKLLRVIQDGAVRRVGSEAVDAMVNVRFIAATNRDPREAIRTGALREDLYYRLRVVPLTVPPLRERPEDTAVLADHFLRHSWLRHRDPGLPMPTLSAAAVHALCGYGWPGNVRELQNVIEHAVVLAEPGAEIAPRDLPFPGNGGGAGALLLTPSHLLDRSYRSARDRVIAEFERGYLTTLVQRANGNMSEAARLAGVDRTTLYHLMAKNGLQRETIISVESMAGAGHGQPSS